MVPQEDTQDMRTYSWLWFIATEGPKTNQQREEVRGEAWRKPAHTSRRLPRSAHGGHVCSVVSDSVTPGTVACQAPWSMGFLQARMLKWVAIARYLEFLLGADHVDTLCLKVKVTHSCLTLCDPWTSPWNSPGRNTGVGSLSLLQGIFPTQGLNPGLPHWRQTPY